MIDLVWLLLYFGFVDNFRGYVLVDLFDQCMVQFVDVGMLRLIFECW